MATAYTSLLGLALPVTGELSGTWGDVVNDSITQLIEDSVAGTATASVTSGDWTLTTTGSGAANQARCAILIPTGTPGVSRNIIAPSQSKAYVVNNQSDAAVVLKGAATTGVSIPAGSTVLAAWDGTDFVTTTAEVNLATDVTGVLPAANGGTGISSPGTSGNVLTSTGTGWASSPPPAGGISYVYKTANYTTQNNEGVLANTTGGTFTVTLPASPVLGWQVVVADAGGAWGTNDLIIGRNGATIAGIASDLTCDIAGASVQLVYSGTTWEVYAQVGGNGGFIVTLDGAQTLTNKTISGANNTLTVDGVNSVGYLKIPKSGSTKTTSYTLQTSDVGEFIEIGTGGSIVIPDATFATGDAVVLFNNTSGNITITCSITTAYIAGTDSDKATITLATRGLANVVFISGTVAVVSGNVT